MWLDRNFSEVDPRSLIIGGGSLELRIGSVNRGSRSQARCVGSPIRRDPAEFKPACRIAASNPATKRSHRPGIGCFIHAPSPNITPYSGMELSLPPAAGRK